MTQAVDWRRVRAIQQAWNEGQAKWEHELKTVIRPRAERSMYDAKRCARCEADIGPDEPVYRRAHVFRVGRENLCSACGPNKYTAYRAATCPTCDRQVYTTRRPLLFRLYCCQVCARKAQVEKRKAERAKARGARTCVVCDDVYGQAIRRHHV